MIVRNLKGRSAGKVIVTSCDNCLHYIEELSDHYNPGVRVMNVAQIAFDALVPE